MSGDVLKTITDISAASTDQNYTEVSGTDSSDGTKRGADVALMSDTTASLVSTSNSTTSTLSVAATYSGTSEDVSGYSTMALNVYADVNSAVNGLVIYGSPDGTNWVTVDTYSVVAAVAQEHLIEIKYQYYKIGYTNGNTAQSEFRLQVIYHKSRPIGNHGGVEKVIKRYEDAPFTRQVNDVEFDRNEGLIDHQSTVNVKGRNDSVGTSYEYISDDGASLTIPSAAETVRIKAGGNAADTAAGAGALQVTVYGLDDSFDLASETLATAGASASSATTTLFSRIYRVEVSQVGVYGAANTGDITIENTSTNDVLAIIKAGMGVSQSSIYTIPRRKTGKIIRLGADSDGVERAEVNFFKREQIDVTSSPAASKQLIQPFAPFTGRKEKTLRSHLIIPEKTDIWAEGKMMGSNSGFVTADYDLNIVDQDPALFFDNSYSLIFGGPSGGTEYIYAADSASLNITSAISFSFWMYPTSGLNRIFGKTDYSASQASYVCWWAGGYLEPVFYSTGAGTGGSAWSYKLSSPLSLNQWYHIVITYTNSDMHIYVDGTDQALTAVWAVPTDILTSTAPLVFGTADITDTTDLNNPFKGSMDEIAVFNKVLSSTEVSELYNYAKPANVSNHSGSANLVSWWRCGDGDTYPTIADNYGSNDMTMVNMESGDIQAVVP